MVKIKEFKNQMAKREKEFIKNMIERDRMRNVTFPQGCVGPLGNKDIMGNCPAEVVTTCAIIVDRIEAVEIEKNWDYSFKATKESIDFDKIGDDLSYEEPLVLVESGDSAYLVIHKSIALKHRNSNAPINSFTESLKKTKHTVQQISGLSVITFVKESIEDIKNAKWNRTPKTVKVTKINC